MRTCVQQVCSEKSPIRCNCELSSVPFGEIIPQTGVSLLQVCPWVCKRAEQRIWKSAEGTLHGMLGIWRRVSGIPQGAALHYTHAVGYFCNVFPSKSLQLAPLPLVPSV